MVEKLKSKGDIPKDTAWQSVLKIKRMPQARILGAGRLQIANY